MLDFVLGDFITCVILPVGDSRVFFVFAVRQVSKPLTSVTRNTGKRIPPLSRHSGYKGFESWRISNTKKKKWLARNSSSPQGDGVVHKYHTTRNPLNVL